MSYILEALKKSDQQRQRGATPTLQATQVTVVAPKRPMFIYYGLLAAILLGAGIMIGWLRPWQPQQPPPETEPVAAKSPVQISEQAAPATLTAPPERPSEVAQEFPATNLTRAGQPVPVAGAMKPNNPVPVSPGTPSAEVPVPDRTIQESPASLGGVAQEQEAVPLNELPLQIQREIPVMTVQLHAYSSNPSERLVSINSIRLREGGSLMLGLRLEQITPDGMIFSYKGYRFQRGIQ
ncbi:MAG: general secretion pathway protein GspB [Gallionella sp.]